MYSSKAHLEALIINARTMEIKKLKDLAVTFLLRANLILTFAGMIRARARKLAKHSFLALATIH